MRYKDILYSSRNIANIYHNNYKWIKIIMLYIWNNMVSQLWKKVKVLVPQPSPSLGDPMDSSPSVSSIHAIFQARILGWVAVLFSRGSSGSRYWTQVSCIAGRNFTIWATREDFNLKKDKNSHNKHQLAKNKQKILLKSYEYQTN